MKNSEKNKNYTIGLDIGTTSVGYAVCDENCNPLKHKGQNMWGVRLFTAGVAAKETRLARGARRRYLRRRTRIDWLQGFFNEEMNKVSPNFFIKMKESFFVDDDRTLESINDELKDFGYKKNFKTIYHLRKYLMETSDKADIRLVYLALHHIVKYRGNFLCKRQEFDLKTIDNTELLTSVIEGLSNEEAETSVVERAIEVLKNNNLSKKDKEKTLKDIIGDNKEEKKYWEQLWKALLGDKADFALLFSLENGEEKSSDNGASYRLDEEKAEVGPDSLDDEQTEIYENIIDIYKQLLLTQIMHGNEYSCISEAMIAKYNKHKEQLIVLKRVYKELLHNKYYKMFRSDDETLKNYSNYINSAKKCSRDDYYNAIRKDIEGYKGNRDVDECLQLMDNNEFLLRINSRDNGALPYQLHMAEMERIIENQGRFYPFLTENKDKLLSIVSFRIPYYVGPLNSNPENNGRFSWAVRKDNNQKIYPWNIEDVIDYDASAEKFITRMTGKCTYLLHEDVLPRYSLLYSEFAVINELTKTRVENSFLDSVRRECVIEGLFKEGKKVTNKRFIEFLYNKKYITNSSAEVEGNQGDNCFLSTLTSYNDFLKIFGKVDESNYEKIENLILWITLFEDKRILEKRIVQYYPETTDEQLNQICKLNYKGWGRLSKKLLTGLKYIDSFGNGHSIMDLLHESPKNDNLMQILNDKKYGFEEKIKNENLTENRELSYDLVDEIATSPANKRGIWQALLVIKEITHIMGKTPAYVDIEFARQEENDKKGKRTPTRYYSLEKALKKTDSTFDDIKKQLEKYRKNEKALDDKKLYLYFLQNGKCMYSGKELSIDDFGSYEIDHIIPRCYVKDDSIDNLALVYKEENQRKADSLLLDEKIINSQRAYWRKLLDNKLISRKKFDNLTREKINEKDAEHFIARQLVETRQMIKNVAGLITQLYPETKVYEIRADITHQIRENNCLYKCRDVNDYHHAFDAYLSAVAGTFIRKCFPSFEAGFNYSDYRKFISKKNKDNMNISDYVMSSFSGPFTDIETGEIIWDGTRMSELLRKRYCYKDCFISRMVEEQTREFYEQTIRKKSSNKLIPLKSGMETEKYGGYKGEKQAYYIALEYKKSDKKQERKIIGMPIRIVELEKSKKGSISEYLNENYSDCRIIKNKIMKYQKVLFDNIEYYIVSDNEVIKAKQLLMPYKEMRVISMMNRKKNNVSDDELIVLYDVLCEKIRIYEQHKKIQQKMICAREKFAEMKYEEKVNLINQILKITGVNSENGNLKAIGLTNREGREREKTLYLDRIVFIDTSVTGMYERRYKI